MKKNKVIDRHLERLSKELPILRANAYNCSDFRTQGAMKKMYLAVLDEMAKARKSLKRGKAT